jgi:hypothetical protein
MTARDLAFLGCRLLAVYFFFSALAHLPFSLAYVVSSKEAVGSYQGASGDWFYTAGYLMVPVAELLVSAAIFYASGFLSGMLVLQPDREFGKVDSASIVKVGLLLIGVVMFLWYLPGLLQLGYEWVTKRPTSTGENAAANLIANVIGVVMSVGLVLWGSTRPRTDEPSQDET